MKVLMVTRSNIFSTPGGDTTQIVNTSKALRERNIEVDIYDEGLEYQWSSYDIIHFFNITRPLPFINIEKYLDGIPLVISPIYVNYSEVERKTSIGIRQLLAIFLSNDTVEYLKNIIRFLVRRERYFSWKYLFCGQRRTIKRIIKKAVLILPNSENEARRIEYSYKIKFNHFVVNNAIDNRLFNRDCDRDIDERFTIFCDSVVCVGRIEPLKNQLNVIKALNGNSYKVFIIGKPAPGHVEYYQRCVEAAEENINFVDHINHHDLSIIFKVAKVHVLASWFETTGLVSLEAGACGCNVVVTKKGDQTEYMKDDVWYCSPDSIESIRSAVNMAFNSEINEEFSKRINENYTWEITAEQTLQGYEVVLNEQQ